MLETSLSVFKWTKSSNIQPPSWISNARREGKKKKKKKKKKENYSPSSFFVLINLPFFEIQPGAFAWNLVHYIQVMTKDQHKTIVNVKCTLERERKIINKKKKNLKKKKSSLEEDMVWGTWGSFLGGGNEMTSSTIMASKKGNFDQSKNLWPFFFPKRANHRPGTPLCQKKKKKKKKPSFIFSYFLFYFIFFFFSEKKQRKKYVFPKKEIFFFFFFFFCFWIYYFK